jgi:predicted PurR-regulated permease PerM
MEVVKQPGPEGHPEPEPILIRMPVDVRSVALTVIAAIGGILMLQHAQPVLVPIVIGILLSYILTPAVNALEGWRVPRILGSILVLVLLCGALGFGAYTLSGQAMEIVESVPAAAQKVVERTRTRQTQEAGTIEKVQEAARQVEEAAEQATEPTRTARRPGVQRVEIVEPTLAASQYLWEGGRGVLALLAQFTMVLFLVFFLLVAGDLFKRKLVSIAGPTLTKKKISVQIMDEINRQITSFLRVQVIANVVVAVATALALWAFGLDNFIMWGLLAGLFNTIPYFGAIIVTAGLGVVSFIQFDEVLMVVYVCSVAMAITGLEGWLLRPALISRAAQMNPVAIFIGLLFWTWVWGVWGTLLAVPMMMVLKAICDRIEGLMPVGELLGE